MIELNVTSRARKVLIRIMDYSSSIQWFYEACTYPLRMSTHNMLWAYMVFYIDVKMSIYKIVKKTATGHAYASS